MLRAFDKPTSITSLSYKPSMFLKAIGAVQLHQTHKVRLASQVIKKISKPDSDYIIHQLCVCKILINMKYTTNNQEKEKSSKNIPLTICNSFVN